MSDKNEFFVGYLATPAGLKKFYRLVVPLLMLIGLAVGAWFATQQRSSGEGVWDLSEQRTFSGFLTLDPYPVLHEVGDDQRSVIIVQQGKKSAEALLKNYANQWISISGYGIQRGDWSMVEVPATTDIVADTSRSGQGLPIQSLGTITLQGEIIDSKCYLGVMKPGAGKVHRACAAMCLRGGLPPMFVAKTPDGKRYGYLLTHENGDSAAVDLAEHVAVPVKVTGDLEKRGDIVYLRLRQNSLARLSAAELEGFGDTLADPEMDGDSMSGELSHMMTH